MRSHEWIDERSLALHEAVAAKLEREPQLLDIARANLQRWTATGSSKPLRAEQCVDQIHEQAHRSDTRDDVIH